MNTQTHYRAVIKALTTVESAISIIKTIDCVNDNPVYLAISENLDQVFLNLNNEADRLEAIL